jgi:membrane-associated phospholipid phosphatase
VLSAVLHPLLMPTLLHGLLLVFAPSVFTRLDDDNQWRLLLMIFILTFLLPLFITYFLLQAGWAGSWRGAAEESETPHAGREPLLQNLRMEDRSRRIVPFLFTTFIYGADTFLLTRNLSSLHLSVVILAAVSVCIGLVTLVTLFWKISAHAVGTGGLLGFLFGIVYDFAAIELLYPTLACVLATGLLLSARLYLNAHTPAQVAAGFLLGLAVCFTAVVMWG